MLIMVCFSTSWLMSWANLVGYFHCICYLVDEVGLGQKEPADRKEPRNFHKHKEQVQGWIWVKAQDRAGGIRERRVPKQLPGMFLDFQQFLCLIVFWEIRPSVDIRPTGQGMKIVSSVKPKISGDFRSPGTDPAGLWGR